MIALYVLHCATHLGFTFSEAGKIQYCVGVSDGGACLLLQRSYLVIHMCIPFTILLH